MESPFVADVIPSGTLSSVGALTDVLRLDGTFTDCLGGFPPAVEAEVDKDDADVPELLLLPELSPSTLGARISMADGRAGTNIGAEASTGVVSGGYGLYRGESADG